MKTILGLKPALTALVVLLLFIILFVAFLVAPLLLVVLVAGGMWGYERWNNSRRQPGVRTLAPPRSLTREVGTRRVEPADQNFGFGSGVGREL
jgi:hypothetical protein